MTFPEPPILERAASWPRHGSDLGIPFGPRPAAVTIASALYALAAAANGVSLFTTDASASRARWVLVSLVLYCAALAVTAARVRPWPERRASFPWMFAPVVVHALVGLLGSVALLLTVLTGAHIASSARGSLTDALLATALVAALFGWAPVILLCAWTRRAGWLLAASLSWPVWLVASTLVGGPLLAGD